MSIILQREIHLLVVVGIASTHQRLYCWDKAAVPLLYNRGTIKQKKKDEKKTHESYIESFASCGLRTDKARRIEVTGGHVAAWRGGG